MVKEALAKNPRLLPNEQRELARVVGMDYEKVKKWYHIWKRYLEIFSKLF